MRTLKKYPNRRLYDTSQSCYVTIDNVRDLVLGHERFRVVDSKSGEDLTRSILLQIILNQREVMQDQVRSVIGSNSPIGVFQKMTEDNMKLWESMSQTMLGRKSSTKDE